MSREEDDARQALRALVERLSPAKFRTVCIEALRRWRKDPAGEPCVQVNGQFGRVFAQVLAEQGGDVPQPVYWKECLLNDQEEPYLAPFIEFCWWLFVAGLATPLRWKQGGGTLARFTLTAAGHRFLDAHASDPLAPGVIARLRERCPSLPDEVLEHLGDAERCLRLQLLRPAVTLLGLAYEVAVEQALDALARAGRVEQTQVDCARKAAAPPSARATLRTTFVVAATTRRIRGLAMISTTRPRSRSCSSRRDASCRRSGPSRA